MTRLHPCDVERGVMMINTETVERFFVDCIFVELIKCSVLKYHNAFFGFKCGCLDACVWIWY